MGELHWLVALAVGVLGGLLGRLVMLWFGWISDW